MFASGDGKVTKVSKNATAGRHIEIRHGEQYRTRYLHLSAFARGLKTGARVRQGQTIGFVGRSGRVTGPHLHYEFLVNGVHRNPRTVSLPKAAPVQGDYKGDFAQQTQPLLLALKAATPDSGVRIAALDNANDAVSTSGE